MMMANSGKDLMSMGSELVKSDFDDLTDGGFWIWEINTNKEFYSPKFRSTLGYIGEEDFPSTPDSWQKSINKKDLDIAIKNFKEVLKTGNDEKYNQVVEYTTKNGNLITFICSGKLLKIEGEYKFLVGTHKII